MFVYQTIIMAAVVILIYILAYFLKKRNRKILVFSILAIITAGGIGLYTIQYYFGNHFYSQEISTSLLEDFKVTPKQADNLNKIFDGYENISANANAQDAYRKSYKINANGAASVIDASVYTFSNAEDADKYFEANQKFFDNKNYIPLDTLKSKRKGSGVKYLVSLIKSQYKDYADLFYMPSKITYSSDVTIEYNNVIIVINETSNEPVSNKSAVIEDINKKLAKVSY
ncbi:MAG TPA: hypothetical protein VHO66_07195 [Ruminiclostridium sp.]|nr:hypothetical protein [Ruminiclostridium sp.]